METLELLKSEEIYSNLNIEKLIIGLMEIPKANRKCAIKFLQEMIKINRHKSLLNILIFLLAE